MSYIQKKKKLPSLVQSFNLGDTGKLEATIEILNNSEMREIKFPIPLSGWKSLEGKKWFDFLIHEIGSKTNTRIIPVISSTHQGNLVSFVEIIIKEYDKYFEWIEITDVPEAKEIAKIAHAHGKKVALGDVSHLAKDYIVSIKERGLLRYFDAISLTFIPDSIGEMKKLLDDLNIKAEVWFLVPGALMQKVTPERKQLKPRFGKFQTE